MAKRQVDLAQFGFSNPKKGKEIKSSETQTDTSEKNQANERKFLPKWQNEFSWLVLREGKMFCKICETSPTMAGKTDFVSNGSSAFKKENLTAHGQSKHHKDIRDSVIGAKQSGSTVQKNFERQNCKLNDATMKDMSVKMTTAYSIAKEELPFTKFVALLDIQKRNGIEINDNYANDVKCAEMIQCISETMKEDMSSQLLDSMYYSVMIDAGTDVSVKEVEAMNIRYIADGIPVTKLLGVIELEHAHAEGTVKAIKKALNEADFPSLEQHLVGFCADGAAVNFGKQGGVQKLLTDSAPWLIAIWCLPHRLELAVMNMMKKSQSAAAVMDILHLIYKTYHYSPKSRRELKVIGEELGVSIRAPTRVRGTRWSPHIKRALHILLKPSNDNVNEPGQYAITNYQHMEHLASVSSNNDVKGRAKHVAKKMKNFEFCAFCHFVLDMLNYISELSLTLQSNKLILPTVINALHSCIASLEALAGRAKPGGFLSKYFTSIKSQRHHGHQVKFQGIELSDIRGTQLHDLDMDTMPLAFRRHLSSAIDLITDGMKERYAALIGEGIQEGPAKAVKAFDVFNHDKWPDNANDIVDYGDEEIEYLVEWFGTVLERNGCNTRRVLPQWALLKHLVKHEFGDKSFSGLWQVMLTKEPYKDDYEDILHLVRILLVIPLSSAQCERTISAMNRIKSDVRNSLDPSTVETLIRISSEGPPLSAFDPIPSIRKWFSSTRKVHYRGWPHDILFDDDDEDIV